MSESPSKIAKIYQETEKLKIRVEGKYINSLRKYSIENLEKFWSEEARELRWDKMWDKTLQWDSPFAKWFVGGRLNACVNCLDRHINTDVKNKLAIVWEGENGENRSLSYYQLYRMVNKFASGLRALGVSKGDRVAIYLPLVPELVVAMLACARIGATHTVIFSGFSANAISDRVNDSESKVIITADGSYRRGKLIELKKVVDQAIDLMPTVNKVVVLKRANIPIPMNSRDVYWDDLIRNVEDYCTPESVESTHPLFILYTSGTTGRPKGVVHSTAGYLTHIYSTSRWVFNFNNQDIFFCTADIGWVTGHSYIAYSPLLNGITQVIYEGAPDFPRPDRYWSIVEKHGVTILYTTPTALRMYMKFGDSIPYSFDLSSIRLLGTVGEPINPEVWLWYFKVIGKEKCQIVDTWWQTETGGIILGACTALDTVPMKPGSATLPVPGIDATVVDDSGKEVPPNTKGFLVIKNPWPGMLMTLWKDNEKFAKTYWSKFANIYYPGDYAMIDEDGYIWLLGRSDDVLKIAGHRIGTMEIESAFVSHKSVAESAVTGKKHPEKGESIVAFVVLKQGIEKSNSLYSELVTHIRNSVGPIATPESIYFVERLPKTRSGKIMRRLLRNVANGEPAGDTSTLEDGTSVQEVLKAYEEINRHIER